MGAIQNQRLVELMSNQVKNLQVQKQGMEMAMMEMKNEMANERFDYPQYNFKRSFSDKCSIERKKNGCER